MSTRLHSAATTTAIAEELGISHTLAERVAAKRHAREELLRARSLRPKVRTAVVALVTTHADTVLLAQMREALAALSIVVVEMEMPDAKLLLPCDLALILSADLADSPLAATALSVGCVPVLAESIAPKAAAEEYDPVSEQGNSFYAREATIWSLFAAVARAVETYRFPYDWQGIVRSALTAAK